MKALIILISVTFAQLFAGSHAATATTHTVQTANMAVGNNAASSISTQIAAHCHFISVNNSELPGAEYGISVKEEDENEDSNHEKDLGMAAVLVYQFHWGCAWYRGVLPHQKYPASTARYLLVRSLRL